MTCHVGETTEVLENALWHMWSDVRVGEWGSASSTVRHRHFTYITGTLPASPGEQPMLSQNTLYITFHSLLEFRLAGRPTVTPMHWLLLHFWGNVCNPRFTICDDPAQKLVAITMVPLQKCQCWLLALFFVLWCQILCFVQSKLYHKAHHTVVGGRLNKSLHLQPLQRYYCENSGSPTSACVMRRHYSIT